MSKEINRLRKPFPNRKSPIRCPRYRYRRYKTNAAQGFPKAIRSTQQLAEPLPALSGQADPIRSFQYVYNPLIARFSWHNLKLFLGVIRDARFPASSTATFPSLSFDALLTGFAPRSLTSFCGSWIAEFHGLDSLGFKRLAREPGPLLSDLHSPFIINEIISMSRHIFAK